MACRTIAYAISCTAWSINNLRELNPGDHIRVKGGKADMGLEFYTHHLLVVRVVNDTTIEVIHNTTEGGVVKELVPCNSPRKITVLDYNYVYTREEVVRRARKRIGNSYNLYNDNCEHFVTEVTSGTRCSLQVEGTVEWLKVLMVAAVVTIAALLGWN